MHLAIYAKLLRLYCPSDTAHTGSSVLCMVFTVDVTLNSITSCNIGRLSLDTGPVLRIQDDSVRSHVAVHHHLAMQRCQRALLTISDSTVVSILHRQTNMHDERQLQSSSVMEAMNTQEQSMRVTNAWHGGFAAAGFTNRDPDMHRGGPNPSASAPRQ